jgi:ABC-type sulfate transport system substrate-binding protein
MAHNNATTFRFLLENGNFEALENWDPFAPSLVKRLLPRMECLPILKHTLLLAWSVAFAGWHAAGRMSHT